MTRFVVDLGNHKLSDEQKSALSSAIQSVVLTHLGQHQRAAPSYVGYIPREWLGFILREKLSEIEGAVQENGKFAAR